MTPCDEDEAGDRHGGYPTSRGGRRAEEDRAQQVVAGQQVGGRPVEADLAALDEEGVVGQAHGPVHALLDEDHRGAVGVDPPHDVHEPVDGHGGQAEGQLVDHQQPGPGHHHPGQRQHLLLAARQRAGAAGRAARPARGTGRWPRRARPGPGPCRAGTSARRCGGCRARSGRGTSSSRRPAGPTPWSMICSGSR